MTKEEFIKSAVLSGYSNNAAAELYAENSGRDEFNDDDFVQLYHQNMRWNGCAADKGLLYRYGVNGKTTAGRNGVAGNSGAHQDWK